MQPGSPVVHAVHAALGGEPRIDLLRHPIRLEYQDNVLTMEGEVGDVSAKKLALELAARTRGVSAIVDRLHITPAQRLPDRAILTTVRDMLLEESALQPCALCTRLGSKVHVYRAASPDSRGWIELRVEDGVITLDGEVSSLAQKRLAGVLAWWTPGARDVVDGLGVVPPEEDGDDEITDAVAIVLQKDPFVNAGQIRVHTHDGVVTLDGAVHSDTERRIAERDAWCVFGVDKVEDHLAIVP